MVYGGHPGYNQRTHPFDLIPGSTPSEINSTTNTFEIHVIAGLRNAQTQKRWSPPPTETLINFLIWNATQCMTTSFLLPEVS